MDHPELTTQSKEAQPGAPEIALDFGKSFVQSAIITPVWNGLGQLVTAGHLPQISIINSENAKNSSVDDWAQKIGGAVGMAADFFVLSKLKVGVFGESVSAETANSLSLGQRSFLRAAEGAKVGAAYGTLFVPSAPDDNLIFGRVKNAFTNGVTFGALSGMAEGLGGLGVFKNLRPGTMAGAMKDIGVMGGVGFPAGAIGAETDSLVNQGKLASWKSIKDQAIDYGVIGFALSGMTHGMNSIKGGSIAEVTRAQTNNQVTAPEDLMPRPIDRQTPRNAVVPRLAPIPENPIVSLEVIDGGGSKMTHTVLQDQTVIEEHPLLNLKVTTFPDGTRVEESNRGHRTIKTDGTEVNVTAYRTETRDAEGKWTFKSNKWADAWENWSEISHDEKRAALETLDGIPKAGNLVANLVGNGLAEHDPILQELAVKGIKDIPQPDEQHNQWSLAIQYHPEFAPELIQMIPELKSSAQQRIQFGQGFATDVINVMSTHNQFADEPHPMDKAIDDFAWAVQDLPMATRKAIWSEFRIQDNGTAPDPIRDPLASKIYERIAGRDEALMGAFSDFASFIQPNLEVDAKLSRRGLRIKRLDSVDEKFDEFKRLVERERPNARSAFDYRDSLSFLEANRQLDLQQKIIDWGNSHDDPSVRSLLDWRFSPAKRSVEMTNEIIRLAKADELPSGFELEQVMHSPFDLSKRAKEYNITPEQELATKQKALQLLQIADANRGPNGELTRAGNQFRMAGLQIMAQAGDPFLITQGAHPTCALGQVEFSTFLKHPDEAARLINEVMRTGKFVTQDGTVIKVDPQSLRPEDSSLEMNKTRFEYPQDAGYRSYASQIFQTTAANIYWQRQTIAPDGLVVPKGSLRYEIHFEDVLDAHGNVLGNGPKDELMDYSQTPPVTLADSPYIVDHQQLVDIGEQIGGERTKPNIVTSYPHNEAEFLKYLQSLPYPESFPLLVAIDGNAMTDPTKPMNALNHTISILSPWQAFDRIAFRNTWFAGDRIADTLPTSRFWEITGP